MVGIWFLKPYRKGYVSWWPATGCTRLEGFSTRWHFKSQLLYLWSFVYGIWDWNYRPFGWAKTCDIFCDGKMMTAVGRNGLTLLSGPFRRWLGMFSLALNSADIYQQIFTHKVSVKTWDYFCISMLITLGFQIRGLSYSSVKSLIVPVLLWPYLASPCSCSSVKLILIINESVQ